MSFLPPSGTPFSYVTENPTATQLNNAIQAGLQNGTIFNAPPAGGVSQPPGKTVVVGGGNTTTVTVPDGGAGDILVTGAGIRVNLVGGPSKVQGTNLGGGGLVIETLQNANGPSGTTPDYTPKIIDLSANYSSSNLTINTNELVGGNISYDPQQSISEASGGLADTAGFVFYAHGGSGDDLLIGSSQNDFLRGGAGNDQINAGAGDDLVRGGAGFDTIQLGIGKDALFYTVDQIDNTEDYIADFSSVDDTVYFDAPPITDSNVQIVDGGNAIQVNLDGKSLRIVSGADNFQSDDIKFI